MPGTGCLVDLYEEQLNSVRLAARVSGTNSRLCAIGLSPDIVGETLCTESVQRSKEMRISDTNKHRARVTL